jgi:hypothetical protein
LPVAAVWEEARRVPRLLLQLLPPCLLLLLSLLGAAPPAHPPTLLPVSDLGRVETLVNLWNLGVLARDVVPGEVLRDMSLLLQLRE